MKYQMVPKIRLSTITMAPRITAQFFDLRIVAGESIAPIGSAEVPEP